MVYSNVGSIMPPSSTLHQRLPRPIGPDARRRPPLVVLGLDPGLQRTGYGALSAAGGRPSVREAGVLVTRSRDGLAGRLLQLYRDIDSLLRDLRPAVIVLEDLFVHHEFPRTALVLGHARGIIMLAAAAAGVRVIELPPSSVKRAVAGSGRASKTQMQRAVRVLLGVRGVSNTHAADALALAYAGWSRALAGPARAVGPRGQGRTERTVGVSRRPGVRG
jgi:crossover junction endodeoxyribonuclease RuvC